MGIYNIPHLIYGIRLKHKNLKKILKYDNNSDEDYEEAVDQRCSNLGFPIRQQKYIHILNKYGIEKMNPRYDAEDEECHWYYAISKYESTFQGDKMFDKIVVPAYDKQEINDIMHILGVKKYKIGFYLEVDVC